MDTAPHPWGLPGNYNAQFVAITVTAPLAATGHAQKLFTIPLGNTINIYKPL